MLQTRLDSAHQCLDLSTGQAIVEGDPGHNPDPARTDKGEEEW